MKPEHEVAAQAAAARSVADLAAVLRTLRRREARRRNGAILTYQELVDRTGWSVPSICGYFTGTRLPPINRFDELVQLLGADVRELGPLATARDRIADAVRAPADRRASTPTVIPHMLPPRVPRFTGRATHLAALDALLEAGLAAGTVVISAVAGMAGVGKTTLAVHWAHRVATRFPDGQLYVDLNGFGPGLPRSTMDALGVLLAGLGVPAQQLPADEAARTALYRTLVAGRRLLVLLDNTDSAERVRSLLPPPPCLTVVTSRDDLGGLVAVDGARRVLVDILPPGEAAALLRQLIGGRANREPAAVDALARQCGYLPLALGIAARHAAGRPSTSLAELVDEIRNATPLDLKVTADADVRTVFAWSLRRLPGPAARAFRLLGMAAPAHFDVYGLAALAGVTPRAASRLVQVLTRAHLVQPVGRGRYSMHDLLRDYAVELAARELTPPERSEAAGRALDYLLTTATAAVDAQFPASRPAAARYRPQPVHPTTSPPLADAAAARAWLAAERENLVRACVRAARFGFAGHAVALALVLRRFLDHGHFDDALTVHTTALAAAVAPDTDCDDAQRAQLHTALGITHWRLGQLDAAGRRLQHAISAHRDLVDADGTARNLALLGLVRDTQGRFAEALELHHEGLRVARAAGLPAREAAALVNIAFAHVHLREFARAVEFYQQARLIVARLDQRYPHAVVAAGLAIAYEGLGCYDVALAHGEEALLVNQEFDLPRGRALILDGVGSIYRRLGRLGDALDVLGEALDACRDINNRAAAAQIHNTLGETHREAGALASALACHREAFAIADRLGVRLQFARALEGLGDVHAALEGLESGRRYWAQADRAYAAMGVPVAQRIG